MANDNESERGFANMSEEERREIARRVARACRTRSAASPRTMSWHPKQVVRAGIPRQGSLASARQDGCGRTISVLHA